MKNKWLIMFIFIIAVTLFLSIDTSKVKFNGDSEYNYNYYYSKFKDKALNTTTGVINGVTNTMNTISNTFNNVWNFLNNLFSNNNPTIDSIKQLQQKGTITNFSIFEKKQNFMIEYFAFEISGNYKQVCIIGKNLLVGASSGTLVNDYQNNSNYIEFSYTQHSLHNDYGYTIYNTNITFISVLKKEDLAALNDIDLIIIPFNIQSDNFELYNNLSDYLGNKEIQKMSEELNELGVSYWLVKDVDENETGTIGKWIDNYTLES